mmetsp:Transcript_28655/g.82663  ORF Transcript_28655/g.82663 Transcript_28655/m.82663 type:complete len:247 (+) Transcript_28655:35-775(+)
MPPWDIGGGGSTDQLRLETANVCIEGQTSWNAKMQLMGTSSATPSPSPPPPATAQSPADSEADDAAPSPPPAAAAPPPPPATPAPAPRVDGCRAPGPTNKARHHGLVGGCCVGCVALVVLPSDGLLLLLLEGGAGGRVVRPLRPRGGGAAPTAERRSVLHKGHSKERCSHSSMHCLWKYWLQHGNLRSQSPGSRSPRQIMHLVSDPMLLPLPLALRDGDARAPRLSYPPPPPSPPAAAAGRVVSFI